jgi:hypothetical protein
MYFLDIVHDKILYNLLLILLAHSCHAWFDIAICFVPAF